LSTAEETSEASIAVCTPCASLILYRSPIFFLGNLPELSTAEETSELYILSI